jgi:hypothetical protein
MKNIIPHELKRSHVLGRIYILDSNISELALIRKDCTVGELIVEITREFENEYKFSAKSTYCLRKLSGEILRSNDMTFADLENDLFEEQVLNLRFGYAGDKTLLFVSEKTGASIPVTQMPALIGRSDPKNPNWSTKLGLNLDSVAGTEKPYGHVSRQHGLIRENNGKYYIERIRFEDDNRGKISVNKRELSFDEVREIMSGDNIQIGDIKLKFLVEFL